MTTVAALIVGRIADFAIAAGGILPMHNAYIGNGHGRIIDAGGEGSHPMWIVTGNASGLRISHTVAVAIPRKLVHIQMIPVDVGRRIAKVEAFGTLVTEACGHSVHGQGIASRWGCAVGEESVAVVGGQAHQPGFAVAGIAETKLLALITGAEGDGHVEIDAQPARGLIVVFFGVVTGGQAIEMITLGSFEMTDRATESDALTTMAGIRKAIASAIADHIRRRYTFDPAGLAIVAAFAAHGAIANPVVTGVGHAIDSATGAVASVAYLGLRERLAVGEIDAAVDMVRGTNTGVTGFADRNARALIREIKVAGMGAGLELGGRVSMAGATGAAAGIAPLRFGKYGGCRGLAAGGAVGMTKAVGAGFIGGVECPNQGGLPQVGDIQAHIFDKIIMFGGVGDGVVVAVLCGVGMTFVAADGIGPAVAVLGQQMFGMAAGVEAELILMTAGTAQATVLIPHRGLHLPRRIVRLAVAVAAHIGAGAGVAVVAAQGVERREEHILEAGRLGVMAAISRIKAVMAGAAFHAVFTGVFLMRRQGLVQVIAAVAGGRRWCAVAGLARRHEAILRGQVVIGIVTMAGGAVRAAQIQVAAGAMIATGVLAGHSDMAGGTEIIRIGLVGVVETVGACVRYEIDGITVDTGLNQGQIGAAVAGVTGVAGGAKGSFLSSSKVAITVGADGAECAEVGAVTKGVLSPGARDKRRLATVGIVTGLTEGTEINLIAGNET